MSDDPIFTLMRFQVLTAALTPGCRERLEDAYVFAWDRLVFPLMHDSAAWHKPFEASFVVSKSEMDMLTKMLDDRWREKKNPTFYELEDHFKVRIGGPWDRSKLLAAMRYLRLCDGLFDSDFWSAIVSPTQHPSEAGSLLRAFDRDEDIYFH